MIDELRFYWGIFLSRLHYVLLFTVLGGALGVTLAMLLPPTYLARARLLVESQQIPGDLAASTVETGSSEQLQVIQQRIMSRDTLLDLANRMSLYPRPTNGEALRPDQIVEDLRKRIGINITGSDDAKKGQATLVDVFFSARTGPQAAGVVNDIVTRIVDENVKMRTGVTAQTLSFFQQEVDRLEREMSTQSSKIIAFQEANRGALPDSLEFRRRELSSAQERLSDMDREEVSLRDRRRSLQALYESTGALPGMAAAVSPEQAELDRLKGVLASYAGLENARVRTIRQQITLLEKVVADQRAARSAPSGDGTGEPQTPLDVQLADLDNQLKFIATEKTSIAGQMQTLQQTIDATPNNGVALDRLERDYANLRAQYDQTVENRARAETGDIIEALSKGERISVIEQAIAPSVPTSPKKTKLAVMGTVGGFLAGTALVALLYLLNPAIRRPVEIFRQLEIQPIGTLHYIRTKGEVRRRRARLAGAALTVLILVPLAMWAINEFYMPIDLLVEKVMDRLPLIGDRVTTSAGG